MLRGLKGGVSERRGENKERGQCQLKRKERKREGGCRGRSVSIRH